MTTINSERDIEEALAACSAWLTENKPGVTYMARGGDYALVRKDRYTQTDGFARGVSLACEAAIEGYLRRRGMDV